MEYSYTIDNDEKITCITLNGIISKEIMEKIVEDVWQGKDYRHPCELWDFRSCVLGFSLEDLRELSQFVLSTEAERGDGKVALVTEKPLHFKIVVHIIHNHLKFSDIQIDKTFYIYKPKEHALRV